MEDELQRFQQSHLGVPNHQKIVGLVCKNDVIFLQGKSYKYERRGHPSFGNSVGCKSVILRLCHNWFHIFFATTPYYKSLPCGKNAMPGYKSLNAARHPECMECYLARSEVVNSASSTSGNTPRRHDIDFFATDKNGIWAKTWVGCWEGMGPSVSLYYLPIYGDSAFMYRWIGWFECKSEI